MKAIGYIRVSTKEQGKSGLGLEAQKREIKQFCEKENIHLLDIFEEVETGKGADALRRRPILVKTLEEAKRQKAIIVISKLDRLGRNVNFISSLMQSKTSFIVTQLGKNADSFMLHIYAALSEKERELISERTKAALKVLKDNGVKLGNRTNLDEARKLSNATNKRLSKEFASKTITIINSYRKEGETLTAIANHLNSLGVETRRGGKWHAKTVSRILERY